MFKKLLLAAGFLTAFAGSVWAQNPQCPDRPAGDSTNACANTRFVQTSISNIYTTPHTWSALQTFTGGIASGTTFPISGTFIGSGLTAHFWLNQSGTATSATIPEIGAQFTISSNVGIANTGTAYKIAIAPSVIGGPNSASIYAVNSIVQGYAGAGGYLVTGIESDLNQAGANAVTLGGSTAAYGFVTALGGSGNATSGYWATAQGANYWAFGYSTSGNILTADFNATSNALFGLRLLGTYGTSQIVGTGWSVNPSGAITPLAVLFGTSTVQTGPSVFLNGTTLTFGGGSSGYAWDNQAINANLMLLTNLGALRLNAYTTAGTLVNDTSGNVTTSKVILTDPGSAATLSLGSGKTITVSNTLTFTGTDGSTLAIGTGGTLGTNAYTSTAFAPIASPTFTGTVSSTGDILPVSDISQNVGSAIKRIGGGFFYNLTATNSMTYGANAGLTTVCTITVGNVLTFTIGGLTTKGINCT